MPAKKKDKQPDLKARPSLTPDRSEQYPFTPGSVVRSVAGRDSGKLFIVLWLYDDEYFAVVDGRVHKLAEPKRKKGKHLRMVRDAEPRVLELMRSDMLNDSAARKIVKEIEKT